MPEGALKQVVGFADKLLQISDFVDYPGAVNGLQVENRGGVNRIAAAVDATLATVRLAIAAKAVLLVVHHGLFWNPSHPWTGHQRQLIQALVEGNLAVYSSHLPLDAHPQIGNNILLARALGLKKTRPFFQAKGRELGVRGELRIPRTDLAARLERATGAPAKILPGGPEICRKIGIVTGGAGAELRIAADEGVDTFITGEGPHWTFGLAEACGINALYGGHYATETFGVKALAARIARKFRLPWEFIDHPTGL